MVTSKLFIPMSSHSFVWQLVPGLSRFPGSLAVNRSAGHVRRASMQPRGQMRLALTAETN